MQHARAAHAGLPPTGIAVEIGDPDLESVVGLRELADRTAHRRAPRAAADRRLDVRAFVEKLCDTEARDVTRSTGHQHSFDIGHDTTSPARRYRRIDIIMSDMSDPSLKRVLMAALTLFGRHGFQRTSMTEIAREAGIARATLYLHFCEKRTVFEALASMLVDEALARAEAAWVPGAPLSANVAETLLAKDVGFFKMLRASPHGSELLDLHAGMTTAHVTRLDAGFAALLSRRGREAVQEGADLTAFDDADGFAAFLAAAGSGLKHESHTEEAFRLAVHRLARVSARAANQA